MESSPFVPFWILFLILLCRITYVQLQSPYSEEMLEQLKVDFDCEKGKPIQLSASLGDNMELLCPAPLYWPTPNVGLWTHNLKELFAFYSDHVAVYTTDTDRFKLVENNWTTTLYIKNFTIEDVGQYFCMWTISGPNHFWASVCPTKYVIQGHDQCGLMEPKILRIALGEDVTMDCPAPMDWPTPIDATWTHETRRLYIVRADETIAVDFSRAKRFKFVRNKWTTSLLIKNLTAEDAGEYLCMWKFRAQNRFQMKLCPAKYVIEGLYKLGDTVNLTCEVQLDNFSNNASALMYWTHVLPNGSEEDFRKIKSDRIFGEFEYNSKKVWRHSLHINHLHYSDTGEYRCVVPVIEDSHHVYFKTTVGLDDRVTAWNNSAIINAYIRQDVRIVCPLLLINTKPGTYVWKKNDIIIDKKLSPTKFSNRYKFISKDNDHYALVIKSLKVSDAGNYTCSLPSTSKTAVIQLNVYSHRFAISVEDTFVWEGEDLKLMCFFESTILGVLWYHNEEEITDDSNPRIQIISPENQPSVLLIKNVIPSDAGKYTCVIQEEVDQYNSSGIVTIAKKLIRTSKRSVNVQESNTIQIDLTVDSSIFDINIRWRDNRPDYQVFDFNKQKLSLPSIGGSGTSRTPDKITFNDVRVYHSGEYALIGTAGAKIVGTPTTVNVVVQNSGSAECSAPSPIVRGNDVILTCSSCPGKPIEFAQWFKIDRRSKQKERVPFNSNYEVAPNNQLKIVNGKLADADSYSCKPFYSK